MMQVGDLLSGKSALCANHVVSGLSFKLRAVGERWRMSTLIRGFSPTTCLLCTSSCPSLHETTSSNKDLLRQEARIMQACAVSCVSVCKCLALQHHVVVIRATSCRRKGCQAIWSRIHQHRLHTLLVLIVPAAVDPPEQAPLTFTCGWILICSWMYISHIFCSLCFHLSPWGFETKAGNVAKLHFCYWGSFDGDGSHV